MLDEHKTTSTSTKNSGYKPKGVGFASAIPVKAARQVARLGWNVMCRSHRSVSGWGSRDRKTDRRSTLSTVLMQIAEIGWRCQCRRRKAKQSFDKPASQVGLGNGGSRHRGARATGVTGAKGHGRYHSYAARRAPVRRRGDIVATHGENP
jgi:hypothetical protein